MSGEAAEAISTLNAGYLWMLFNCFCSAAFVLGMRKRIKLTNFKDFDSMSLFAASRSLSTANKLSQRCSITTSSSPSPSFSSAHYSWRTGPAPISPSTFPKANAPTTPAPCYSPVSSAIFISYGSAWCVRVTSSTTYSMVGALNKLPIRCRQASCSSARWSRWARLRLSSLASSVVCSTLWRRFGRKKESKGSRAVVWVAYYLRLPRVRVCRACGIL